MPCTFVCSHSAVCDDADGGDDGICTVCLDTMTDEKQTVTLSCGHTFHSKCVVDVFRRGDSRCPLCRDDPHAEPEDDDGDMFWIELGDRVESSVNFRTGLRNAMSNRIDKRTQRMKTTLRKWKTTRREARADMKEKTRVVAVLEDAVMAKIDAFEKKVWATFHKHHTPKLERAKAAKDAYMRATTQVRNSEVRLAKKYGYRHFRRSRGSRAIRRRRRRRRDDDDEEDDLAEDAADGEEEGEGFD